MAEHDLQWGFDEAHALWEGNRIVFDSHREMGLSPDDAHRIETMLNEHPDLVARVAELEADYAKLQRAWEEDGANSIRLCRIKDARIEELEAENQCDVCCGTGKALSGDCMCGGAGTMSAAARHLRVQLHQRDEDRERLLMALSHIADTSCDGSTVSEAREVIRRCLPRDTFTSTFD